jgi:hypothetical protein
MEKQEVKFMRGDKEVVFHAATKRPVPVPEKKKKESVKKAKR